ncbi:MAG TPA: M48 family metallopeptidase [candidate division Zixibacteria bacterium]|nr:M48 family metallopeptidase [candidate division Zixibacteria bacterium]
MSDNDSSLAGRAAVAMALTIGFYSLALILGLGTILLPFIIAWATGQLILKLVIVCLISGGAILAAIVPRRDQFEPPGPELSLAEHPRLAEVIRRVAGQTEQAMPRTVYLIPDFNAWVAQHGGSHLHGGDRLMGIGLPLLHQVTVSQFEAVIAHEFGHYHHGDTRLGPRIYQTRAAIVRTIAGLHEHNSILQAPFLWYGRMFLQITHAISRRQEFNADRLAAQVAGTAAMRSALEKINRGGIAFDAYWQSEFVPMLRSRRLPPLLDGFTLFLQCEPMQTRIDACAEQVLASEATDKYDTHPSLRERLAALEALPAGPALSDRRPALDLLSDPAEQERELLRAIVAAGEFERLTPVGWDEVAPIHAARWQAMSRERRHFFFAITPKDLPRFVRDPKPFVKDRPLQDLLAGPNQAQAAEAVAVTVALALASLLVRLGWTLERPIGSNPRMVLGAAVIEPFDTLDLLRSGQLPAPEWLRLCRDTGIGDHPLFPPSHKEDGARAE